MLEKLIYNVSSYKHKKPPNHKVMLRELEEILDIEVDGVNLNKKENLFKLVNAIKQKVK